MVRNAFVVAVVALAFWLGACSGSVYGPLEPTPTPGPTSGTINIVYQRPAGVTCLSVGTGQFDRCSDPVKVTGDPPGWPDPRPLGLQMQVVGGGTFTATATAPTTPPPAKLGIYVIDPWLCPPVSICQTAFSGRGISVNGTRLKDGLEKTFFSFVPPTVYP